MRTQIVKDEAGEPIAAEIMEQAIVDIATAMRRMNQTRLTRKAIVTLIAAQSKVAKRDIEIILNNLEDIEKDWLTPKLKS